MPLLYTPRSACPVPLQHSWSCPPAGHPLWTIPGFCPMVRFRVDAHSSDRPPGDSTTYASTPAGSAALCFSWLRYIQTQLRRHNNPSAPFVSLHLQNWGNTSTTNAYSLLLHPDDSTGSDPNTPFTAAGIAANLSWTTTFAEPLASLIDASDDVLPPYMLTFDHEERFLASSWFPDTGTWTNLLADSRTSSEEITPTFTVEGSPNPTLSDWLSKAVNSDNDPLSPSTSNTFWEAQNDHIRNFFHRLTVRVWGEALEQALLTPMLASFPSLQTSNWQIAPWLSPSDHIPDKAVNLLEDPGVPLPLPSLFTHASLEPYFRNQPSFTSPSTFALWLAAYNVPSTSDSTHDLRNLHIAMYKRQMDSLTASGIPFILWLPFNGYSADYTGTTIPGTPTLYDTNERINAIALHAASCGNPDIIYWHNTTSTRFTYSSLLNNAITIARSSTPRSTRTLPRDKADRA